MINKNIDVHNFPVVGFLEEATITADKWKFNQRSQLMLPFKKTKSRKCNDYRVLKMQSPGQFEQIDEGKWRYGFNDDHCVDFETIKVPKIGDFILDDLTDKPNYLMTAAMFAKEFGDHGDHDEQ
jgi:hypothetical protein